MDIAAVFDALATNAATVTGLNTFGYTPDLISPPALFTADVEVTYDRAFRRGLDELTVTCRLLVAHADDWGGQRQLLAYLRGAGPDSIKVALESDRTLGGACDDLQVQAVRGYGMYEHQGNHFYGAEFTVHVIGDGD